MDSSAPATQQPDPKTIGNVLAGERTSLAFHRTLFASDRTLMATVRTSLSMIGFGFTIYSFFRSLSTTGMLEGRLPERAPVVFGLALTTLGVVLLAAAIWADMRYRRELIARNDRLSAQQLLPPGDGIPPSLAVLAAVLLLLIGLSAMAAIALRL
jgi:putative membrane protein